MAQTRQEIKDTMTGYFVAQPEVIAAYGLTPGNTFEQEFAALSIESILFDVVAFCMWGVQKLWDIFKQEIDDKIERTRVHTAAWYEGKALDFQFGFQLGESDVYDNTGVDEDIVAASKIIAKAAVVKLIQNGFGIVRIKVAKLIGGVLIPLTDEELTAFRAYMNLVADAGTTVVATSDDADLLKLQIDIYYDPLVLSASGARLDGTDDNPLQTAINTYLKSQEFNGKLRLKNLVDHLSNVEGFQDVYIVNAWSKYGTYAYDTTGVASVGHFDQVRQPDSGYLELDTEQLIVEWKLDE